MSLERSSRSSAHERPSASDLDKGCTGRLSARTHSMSTPPMEKSGVDASNHVVLEQVVAKTSRCQSKSAPKSSRKPKNKGGRPTHTQAQHEAAYVAKKQRQRDKRTAASQGHSSGYRLMYRLRSLLPGWSRILQVAHVRHALCTTRCCRGGQWHQMGCHLRLMLNCMGGHFATR